MGFISKLFGKKPAPPPAAEPVVPAQLREALAQPPRLISEAPEFPAGPVVLERDIAAPQIESALTAAGFSAHGDTWTREGTTVTIRSEHGVTLFEATGDGVRDAQRALLGGPLRWVNPLAGFYERMRSPATPIEELRHLACALRHYNCAGGVPPALRTHPDPEIAETVRLIDRDAMARAARAQRAKHT